MSHEFKSCDRYSARQWGSKYGKDSLGDLHSRNKNTHTVVIGKCSECFNFLKKCITVKDTLLLILLNIFSHSEHT